MWDDFAEILNKSCSEVTKGPKVEIDPGEGGWPLIHWWGRQLFQFYRLPPSVQDIAPLATIAPLPGSDGLVAQDYTCSTL